jgi:DNA-binding transcriptional MocR family regulator
MDSKRSGNEGSGQTLVEACEQWVLRRIQGRVFRAGTRLPSIRALAQLRGVSPFTVAEAYDRLVASGDLEARKGSGFYVRPRLDGLPGSLPEHHSGIDLGWLMHHMLGSGSALGPGLGVLPADWLASAQIGAALRALGRQGRWLDSGRPHGFEPLRGVLQQRLAELDILVHPEQLVLTTGITHALNLLLRVLVRPGDTVLTFDPSWFGAHGMLAAHGARVLGVPYTPQGPDLAVLERLAREQHPRLLVLSSAAQNPTGLSLTPDASRRILALAAQHDFLVFEDDVYADLCASPVQRLAAADGLDRVIYAGSFSKTLAANVRVGFLACRPQLARALADAKILSGFTTPELNERLVHKLLVEGRYGDHVAQLRTRLAVQRECTRRLLQSAGVGSFGGAGDGLFFWVDTRVDTNELAVTLADEGLLLAPGSLFSPEQVASSWMRLNVTTPSEQIEITLRQIARSAPKATAARSAS